MLSWRVVVESNDHNRSRLGKYCAWIETLLDLARHPRHFAVVAAGEPLFQARGLVDERFRTHDPDFVKSFEKRAFFDCQS